MKQSEEPESIRVRRNEAEMSGIEKSTESAFGSVRAAALSRTCGEPLGMVQPSRGREAEGLPKLFPRTNRPKKPVRGREQEWLWSPRYWRRGLWKRA
jgi:hypothetical protein